MNYFEEPHESILCKIISHHFGKLPKTIERITIGICNDVYCIDLGESDVIVRLSPTDKYLRGSHDHIPQLKALGIKVPDILEENYEQTDVPVCYQIQNKIEGQDLGEVIQFLSNEQLICLAQEIASIFEKVATLPVNNQFGVIWGGDNDLSNSWTERMKIWVEESIERGKSTGVMDEQVERIATNLYHQYQAYFDSIKPVMYYGDICSKNVMIHKGVFNGLVDLDGLTQGDPLEALGRIKLSWYGTSYGDVYSNTIMDKLNLKTQQREFVSMYALLNKISWACENGIQFNQNTKTVVDQEKAALDKTMIVEMADKLEIIG